MAEETQDMEQQEQGTEEQEKSIWELLDIEEPEGEEYEEEQEEQDEEIAKEDKLTKKLSAKMDNMQKKFEQTILRERISKFEESADDLEKDMFKTIASDVKSPEDFDKAIGVVKKQADILRNQAAEYKQKLEQQAEKETAAAWGTGPLGGNPQKRTPDYEEQLMERINRGDDKAAFEAIVGNELPKTMAG